jgi:predicted phosphate transport protein (TIGR00153 family)
MSILQPREDRFYRLFDDAAATVHRGAELLVEMLHDYTDVPAKAKAIKDVEHAGDELAQVTYEHLNRIFVTPLDREDVGAITAALDDILDLIEAATADFVLCDIEETRPEALELALIIEQSSAQVQKAVNCLPRMSRARAELRDYLTEINRLENEGDHVYRGAIQDLFHQPDPILIIKWKQVLDHLERAIDACEDCADVLQGVLLKYA